MQGLQPREVSPHSRGKACGVIDVLLILRLVSYRSFAQRDAERIAEGRQDPIT